MKRLATVLLFLLASGSALARADEGRIPIAAPGTISAPGDYILTRDIQIASGDGILIDAQHVTLDLNAHRISSTATDNTLIRISPTANFVSLRNGHLSGGIQAIAASSTVGLALFMDGLEIDGSPMDIHGAVRVELSHSRVVMASGSSIYVGGTSGSPLTGRITDNTMEGGSSCLLLVFPKGLLIRDNTLANCGNFGIKLGSTETLASVCGGNLVEHNTITGTGIGIYVGGEAGGNQVVDNVMQADGIGILAWSASNRIAENTIFASDDAAPLGAGIAVTGPRNLIEGNMIGGTTPGCGLLFYGSAATENSWRNNMLRANAGGPVCFVAGGTGSNDGGNVF